MSLSTHSRDWTSSWWRVFFFFISSWRVLWWSWYLSCLMLLLCPCKKHLVPPSDFHPQAAENSTQVGPLVLSSLQTQLPQPHTLHAAAHSPAQWLSPGLAPVCPSTCTAKPHAWYRTPDAASWLPSRYEQSCSSICSSQWSPVCGHPLLLQGHADDLSASMCKVQVLCFTPASARVAQVLQESHSLWSMWFLLSWGGFDHLFILMGQVCCRCPP